jgi:YVTN family beta-propeller protein
MVNAYIANQGSGTVSVIDTSTNTVSTTITVGTNPGGTAVTTDGATAYISNYTDNTVSVIDTSTNTVTATVNVGTNPGGLACTPNGSFIYVPNINGGTVSVIERATNTVTATITVGNLPQAVAITPDGTRAFVTVGVHGATYGLLYAIDTASNCILTSVTISDAPTGIAITPDGTKAYVGCSSTLSVVDIPTYSVITTIGTSPTAGVVFTPDGQYAYVADAGDLIFVIQTSNNTLFATITVGGAGSAVFGVGITPNGAYVYATDAGHNEVFVIDTSTNTVVTGSGYPISVGNDPTGYGLIMQPPLGVLDMGFLNKFRNPNFDITQRGTSGTVTSAQGSAYTFDGWIVGVAGATVSWIQAIQLGPYAGLELTGATGMTDVFVRQRIESYVAAQLLNATGDKSITVQFMVYNATGAVITPTLTTKYAGAQDNWTSSTTNLSAVSLQSCPVDVWTTVAYTWSPSSSNYKYGIEIDLDFGNAINANTNNIVEVMSPDIRVTQGVAVGVNNYPPAPEFRPIGVEFPFCQRYLAGFGETTGIVGLAYATSTTAFGVYIPFKNKMRAAPTGITVTTVADLELVSMAGSNVAALSGLSFGNASEDGIFLTGTVASGLTAGTAYQLKVNTALAGNVIFTGAEL